MRAKRSGFTIVELLIVIVIIAILAAITIVAYNGIQQRANNTAIIDAAAKSKRLVQAYFAANEAYPYTGENEYVCITTTLGCRRNMTTSMPATASFDTEMAKIGALPRSTPNINDIRRGITYNYAATRTVDGTSAPVILSFYLLGINSDCGMKVLNGEGYGLSTASVPYTSGNVGSSGMTQCVISAL